MPANYFLDGQWNAICDVCGLKKKAYQLRKRWDGLMVCKDDWETRHPQTLLRAPSPENITPPWVRPEAPDNFLLVCNIFTSSAYADLGTADCMQADNNRYPYLFLLALYDDTLVPSAPAPAPAPAPSPPSNPALKFNVTTNSEYLALISVGGM